MRIAIMGAGSLGIIIGAYLTKANHDVELVHYNESHVKVLNERGATITGSIEDHIPVKAVTNENMTGTYDLILLLTKQGANKDVLPQLKRHLNNASVVLSLQNGVPEEDVIAAVGMEKVIGGSVEFGATLKEYGVSDLTTDFDALKNHSFQIGEVNGEVTDRVRLVKDVLDLVGGTPNLEYRKIE